MPDLTAFVVTCPERASTLAETLARFRETDWGADPTIVMDDRSGSSRFARINDTWRRALSNAADTPGCSLIVEDDIDLNRYLRHNLTTYMPRSDRVAPSVLFLYNGANLGPGLIDPSKAWGGQGLLISQSTAVRVVAAWGEDDSFADTRIPRLAAASGCRIYMHMPSLIQHVGEASTWGGPFHQAADFDREWRAYTVEGATI